MKVVKILNNNALLAVDECNMEYVYLGNGVGFRNKVNKPFVEVDEQKRYQLSSPQKADEIIERVDGVYIEISAHILSLVQQKFPDADHNILLPLADHIAFAIQRIQNNMDIVNPFVKDIELLFPDEYEIARTGAAIIEKKVGVAINEDEISYITLHIHSAITAEHVQLTLQIIEMIRVFVKQIEQEYGIEISDKSIAYTRFVTHIKFMIARIYHEEKLGVDMNDYAASNFPFSYGKALELVKLLEDATGWAVLGVETGYLALHIERVIQASIKNEE